MGERPDTRSLADQFSFDDGKGVLEIVHTSDEFQFSSGREAE
jgi:hypothetical protein